MSRYNYNFYLRFLGRSDIQEALLLAVNTGLAVVALGIALSSPYGTRHIQRELNRSITKYFQEKSDDELDEEKIRKSLYNLKRKQYVKTVFSEDRKTVRLELTKKGRELLRGFEFHNMKMQPVNTWDGKWRIVLFDVPEKHRYARNILRDKLKRMGFFRIQQSAWVYPHPCKEELRLIVEFLHIQPNVLVFEDKIEQDGRLRIYFQRQKLL